MTDIERQRQFEEDAGRPYLWQQTAREFVVAANYLIDWYDLSSEGDEPPDLGWLHSGSAVPMMVLYAMAVENLLKALLVAQGESLVASGRLKPQYAHHRLVDFAREANLEPTADVEELLRHLSHVMYAGRYPIAKGTGQSTPPGPLVYPADVERVWSLLEQLETALRATGAACLPAVDLRARYRPPGYEVADKS